MIIDKENLFGQDTDMSGVAFVYLPDVIDLGEKKDKVSRFAKTGGMGKFFVSFKDAAGLTAAVFVAIEASDDPAFGSGVVNTIQINVPQADVESGKISEFSAAINQEKRYIRCGVYQNGANPTAGTATCGFVLDAHTNH